jgi:tetratricopeptide (TPR) repeat protein
MIKYFAIAFLLFAATGYSFPKGLTSSDLESAEYIHLVFYSDTSKANKDASNQAMEHFINGSIDEVKGEYASAILEFQDALRIKPSAGIYYALARNYYILNKYPSALENCKSAVSLEPDQLDYQDLLADIFSAAGQFDSAAVVLEGIIHKDTSRVQSYYKLARIYENSKPLEAIKIYNKLTDIIGPDWDVLVRVSQLYQSLGQTDNAVSSLKKLLSIDPENTEVQKLLIQLYEKSKMYDQALKMTDDVLRSNPDDLDVRQLKAHIYLDQNDYKSASKEYIYIVKQPGVPLDSKINIGGLYFSQALKDSSLFPIAENIFEKIDKDTTNWLVKMYLGAISISMGKDSSAMDYFDQVTKLASWNPEGWIRLGGLYFDNHKYDEAEKLMKEALPSFPDNFTINLIMGLSLAQQDKNDSAKVYLKKSLAINPNDINALSGYGYTLSQLHENEEAVIYLQKALILSPNDINLLGTLGLIYNNMNRNAESDSIYQRALGIDSTNAIVNNNYAYSLSERGIKLDDALRMAKIAVASDTTNSSFLDTIGWVYFRLNNLEIAKQYVQKAIKYGGESATMLEHLGDIESKMGNKKEAKNLWQKAFKLDNSKTELKSKIEKGEI